MKAGSNSSGRRRPDEPRASDRIRMSVPYFILKIKNCLQQIVYKSKAEPTGKTRRKRREKTRPHTENRLGAISGRGKRNLKIYAQNP